MKFKLSLLLISALLFQACATLNTSHRKRTIDTNGQTQLIDSKQRAIAIVPNKTAENGDPMYRLCAEPSPDVFSIYALAASAEGNLETNPAGAGGAPGRTTAGGGGVLGLTENASTIERTQTINLMRESMYRTCERYLSGAINSTDMKIQAARDQRAMVAVLAIEQLTGVVKRQPTILTTQTRASLITANDELIAQQKRESEELAKKQANVDKISADLDNAKTEYQALNEGKCDMILTTPIPGSQAAVEPETKTVTGIETVKNADGTEETMETTTVTSSPQNPNEETEKLKAQQAQCRASKNKVTGLESSLGTATLSRDEAKVTLAETRKMLEKISTTIHNATSSGSGSGDSGNSPNTSTEIGAVADEVGEIVSEAFDARTEMVYNCNDIFKDFKNLVASNPIHVSIVNSCLSVFHVENEKSRNRFFDDFASRPEAFNKDSFETLWNKVKKNGSDTEVDPVKIAAIINRLISDQGFSAREFKSLGNQTQKAGLMKEFNSLTRKVKGTLAETN